MNRENLPKEIFRTFPAVFAVNDTYQIMVSALSRCVMWCTVGGRTFFDESNGVLRSETRMHKLTVPAKLLDEARSYTIGFRRFPSRVGYYNKCDLEGEMTFDFRPVSGAKFKFGLFSDVHCFVEQAIDAARSCDMDFLVLNGDIHDNSNSEESVMTDQYIAGEVSHGEIPVVYSRGNHDLRGPWAERQVMYTPSDNGRSYYTFKLGPVWGVVLDCAEDKADESPEYGGVNCCHEFRIQETEFIKQLLAEKSFNAPGIKCRLIICHNNFSQKHNAPFDIESDIYRSWCRMFREELPADLCCYGHKHKMEIIMPDSCDDHFKLGIPAMTAGVPDDKDGISYSGAFVTFSENTIDIKFTDHRQKVVKSGSIPRKR